MRARDLMMTAGDKNTYLVALRDFLIAKYIGNLELLGSWVMDRKWPTGP